ncbi:tetratricopeptide repeat protein [Roseiarcaceae bacterium H3SJ34-1]|uniref:tetratricopeptide repeat protein n=1 Tax=Terripilifer ovatus TaxID=3032367 RepID=UPI003AB93C4A|nr:tetratricopeptide repeat protein [Roseiarcaceae bacterium H3SJ34-1]
MHSFSSGFGLVLFLASIAAPAVAGPDGFASERSSANSFIFSVQNRSTPPAPRSGQPQAGQPAPAAPEAPDDQLRGRDKILAELFDRLGKAEDEDEAKGIAGAIERVWLRSGSDTADLLMNRALNATRQREFKLAEELLDKIVIVEPEWAEAWNQRATARFRADDINGAVADLGQALALEPRHFGALTGLGYILYRAGFDRRALDVMRRALAINPKQDDVRKLVEELTQKFDGRDI